MTNQQIIELASLVLAVDQNPDDEALEQRLKTDLANALPPRLSDSEQNLSNAMRLMLATKLLAGEPSLVVSGQSRQRAGLPIAGGRTGCHGH
jgi:hypothetical protein